MITATFPGAAAVSPEVAIKMLRQGAAPAGLTVKGALDFSGEPAIKNLPEGLSAWNINFAGCKWLKHLPRGLTCFQLDAQDTSLETLPDDLNVELRLDLQNCRRLSELPAGLKVGSLNLSNCTALTQLPEGLEVTFLDISDCPQIHDWPKRGKLEGGRLSARNCVGLARLPIWIKRISQLNLAGCENLTHLPHGLEVDSWIDVGRSGIRSLPRALADIGLRWRGVTVDERIAFRPESLTTEEILSEPNVELRRAMMESMGFERFMKEADAQVLDEDQDAGGIRRLLRVRVENDEDLVCVSVSCPSTQRQYLIRVPPQTKTGRQAIAWTAGFSDPKKYNPVAET